MSVFDTFQIGFGPSSSHTMGPWRAALLFLAELKDLGKLSQVACLTVDLYGSLAKTGKGHATDFGIQLGLCGKDPAKLDSQEATKLVTRIVETESLNLAGEFNIPFCPVRDIHFLYDQQLSFHPNALRLSVIFSDDTQHASVYFSIGGGFVVKDGGEATGRANDLPYPVNSAAELLAYCEQEQCPISEIGKRNELKERSETQINDGLDTIWAAMLASVDAGCHRDGLLPGGLQVKRRASDLFHNLLDDRVDLGNAPDLASWTHAIRKENYSFSEVLKWVSCFALAVNEENAAFGRVVTAPTNGAAGVLPAVLLYYLSFCDGEQEEVRTFLLTAAEIGWIFKKRATISGAMGGCQAEIGVASAMAAAALAERLGGTPAQSAQAAEIAMEHHLGLTCDPVGGLVQIPCIERNCMGAVKAITAATLALEQDPAQSKVSLDIVINTMWETAKDMNTKYKETSEGGLATNLPVNLSDC